MSLTTIIESALVQASRAARRRRSSTPAPRPGAPSRADRFVIGRRLDPSHADANDRENEMSVGADAFLTHFSACGSSGRGKSTVIYRLIDFCLKNKINLVVIMLTSELVDIVLRLLVANGWTERDADRLGIIEVRSGADYIVGFNGLAGTATPDVLAEQAGAAIKEVSDGWGIYAEEALRMSAALLAHFPGEAAITSVEHVLAGDSAYRNGLIGRLPDTIAASPIRRWFAEYDAKKPAAQEAVKGPLLRRFGALMAGDLRLVLSETERPFPLGAFLDDPRGSVLIAHFDSFRYFAAARFACGVFLSALENCIQARADRPEAERRQLEIVLDEFTLMPAGRFLRPLALFRKLKAGIAITYQNQLQVDTETRQTIRSNAATRLYLGSGSGADVADAATDIVLPGLSQQQIKDLLLTQGRGKAVACLPNDPAAAWVELPPFPVPDVPAQAVEWLRAASLQRFGRPRADAERRLLERERRFDPRHEREKELPVAPEPEAGAPRYRTREAQ